MTQIWIWIKNSGQQVGRSVKYVERIIQPLGCIIGMRKETCYHCFREMWHVNIKRWPQVFNNTQRFFVLRLILITCACVREHARACMWVQVPATQARRGHWTWSSGNGELPTVGTGNWTGVLCKNNKPSLQASISFGFFAHSFCLVLFWHKVSLGNHG